MYVTKYNKVRLYCTKDNTAGVKSNFHLQTDCFINHLYFTQSTQSYTVEAAFTGHVHTVLEWYLHQEYIYSNWTVLPLDYLLYFKLKMVEVRNNRTRLYDVREKRRIIRLISIGNSKPGRSHHLLERIRYFCRVFHWISRVQGVSLNVRNENRCLGQMFKYYNAPRLNGQRLSSHFLAVKTGWPFIRANLIEKAILGIEKTGQLSGMAV